MNANEVHPTSALVFGPHATSKPTVVAQELLAYIATGLYQPGDKLPSERELAQRFGVSRTVIREVLAALRIAGVIESRPGDGSYITMEHPNLHKSQQWIADLFKKGDPMEAWRAREVLEPPLARLAAQNATLDDVKRLFAAVERMKTALRAHAITDFYKADRDFHLALAAATHNVYLIAAVNPALDWIVHPIWREIKAEIEQNFDPFVISLQLHSTIARAVANRDEITAEDSTRRHFLILARYLVTTCDDNGNKEEV